MEQIRLDLSHYERVCPRCKGSGQDQEERPYMDPRRFQPPWGNPCPQCMGKGYELTPEGRRLVAFLRRWVTR